MAIEHFTEKQELIPIMGKLMKEMRAIMTKEFQYHDINLTKEQSIVLYRLHEQDGRPQRDLANVTARDKTSLTRLLKKMEIKKLIKRKQSRQDKRINLVYITKKGHKELQKALPIVLNIFNIAIDGIDQKKINETKLLLNKIYNNLNIEHEE